jgi:uncharacterized protein (TIGR02246 family)
MVQTAADIEREVREADAGRVKALLENDLAALEALLGDDLTYVHSSGMLDTKTSYIESLSSGRARYLSMDMSDVHVRALADDVAVIDAKFEARVLARGNELNLKPRVLMVYARRDGRWQMVAWQSTPIANPA